MIKLIKYILITFVVAGCYKKPVCTGTVYSKHGIPLSGIDVTLTATTDARTQLGDWIVATTDKRGVYCFEFRMKRHNQYYVRCVSDSGIALGANLNDTKFNQIDLYLQ